MSKSDALEWYVINFSEVLVALFFNLLLADKELLHCNSFKEVLK